MPILYDIHTHTGLQKHNLFNEQERFPRNIPLHGLVESYEGRIDRIITFPMPGTHVSEKGDSPYMVENQKLVLDIENQNLNGKVLPFVCIHPRIRVTEQLEAILSLMKVGRVYGIKFHTLDTQSFIADFFENSEIIQFCTQYRLPILIHSANFDGYEKCNNIFDFARKHNQLNILIAHMMGFSSEFALGLGKYEHDNLYFDCSPFLGMCEFSLYERQKKDLMRLPFDKPKLVLEKLYELFPNRLVWGSDQPFGDFEIDKNTSVNYTVTDELNLLFSMSQDLIGRVASVNSERFLGISNNS